MIFKIWVSKKFHKSCVEREICQFGEVPFWGSASWMKCQLGDWLEKFNPWTDDFSPISLRPNRDETCR